MWKALSARDWDRMKPFLADDCIYYDVAVGPAAAAPNHLRLILDAL